MPIGTDQLPGGLPPGRLITPDPRFARTDAVAEPVLWVSNEPLDEADAGRRWAELLARHGETGLWPLLLGAQSSAFSAPGRPWHSGELAPVPAAWADEINVNDLLTQGREGGRRRGQLAEAEGHVGIDPDQLAVALATSPGGIRALLTGTGTDTYLGLVPAVGGAEAVSACGWQAEAGTEECTAVLRSWQRRFGVRLCSLGFDSLAVSVAWPPSTEEQTRRVAAEHFAFCPDLAQEHDVGEYAAGLADAAVWALWWD